MEVRISKAVFEANKSLLTKAPFNINNRACDYQSYVFLDLTQLAPKDLRTLKDALLDCEAPGAKSVTRDVETWLEMTTDSKSISNIEATTMRTVKALLMARLKITPHRHLYVRAQDGDKGVVLAYYVEKIIFVKRSGKGDSYVPDHVDVHLVYEEFGITQKSRFTLWPDKCLGNTINAILSDHGYLVENALLRQSYEADVKKWEETKDTIGTQYLAVGVGDDSDVDGNDGDEDTSYNRRWWYRGREAEVILDKDGVPSRVVVDVYKESDRNNRGEKSANYDRNFWSSQKPTSEDEEYEDPDVEITVDNLKDVEIPIHPYVICFDLKRHHRYKIHSGNLTKYVYDKNIRDSLILPKAHSRLIDTLLMEKENHFVDVVKGKSGGMIILCQGPAGTGKTLTSEIYAEALERPLYSVQCAQLGTDEKTLESNLMKVLARGRRWGAVMLLDEADVYVHTRGSDLVQNAIVGVFLRVLEYHSGVLFLTTNRGDLVDDAILSRCTARVPYGIPSVEDQKKIWTVLSKVNDANLSPEAVESIVAAQPKCSGRDIKNLLKLALLVSRDTGCAIDADLITEMKLFKPTVSEMNGA